MLTYNQIIKISREFANAHHDIQNFGNGGEWDEVVHNQQAAYRYPLMWMDDLPSQQSEGLETFSFRVSFSAQVVTLKNRDTDLMSVNTNEVKSNMCSISNDFIAYWINQTDAYPLLTIDKSVSRTTFEDMTDDKLTGCYIDISFRQPFDYNECSIPMGTPTSITTCLPVYIYENGILVDTVASGGSYSYSTGGGTIDISINGVLTFNDQAVDLNIPVITQMNSIPIGAFVDPNLIIPPANIQINSAPYDSVDASLTADIPVIDTLGAPVGSIGMFGVTVDDVTVDNSDVTVSIDVVAEGTAVFPDTNVNIKDSAAATLYSLVIPSGKTVNQTITDSTVNVKNTTGTTLYAKTVKAQATSDQVVADTVVSNSDDTYSTTVVAEGSLELPNITVTDSDGSTFAWPAVKNVTCALVRNRATAWKDGQITSYVTGDAGQYEDGEGVDFFTLAYNNDFGNTKRFTSENGDQTYTAGYVVDHAYKNQANGKIRVWKLGLESAAASTHLSGQPYTYGALSGWKIPRLIDIMEILNAEQTSTALNYVPFSINANSIANSLILQNTQNATTGYRFANSLVCVSATLANTMRRICYRDCTMAEINTL